MATKKAKKDALANKTQDDSKLFAFLAVLLSIVGFLVAYIVKKDNKYVMFYAKQSLVLFFGWLILWVLGMILGFIPVLGMLIYWIGYIGLVVLWIIGLIYSLSGEMKDIPLVGDFARKFNF
jgi:uncharacterized membrane protein